MEETRKASGRGGWRPGSGRPRLDPHGEQRKNRAIYCTKAEWMAMKDYLIHYLRADDTDNSKADFVAKLKQNCYSAS